MCLNVSFSLLNIEVRQTNVQKSIYVYFMVNNYAYVRAADL